MPALDCNKMLAKLASTAVCIAIDCRGLMSSKFQLTEVDPHITGLLYMSLAAVSLLTVYPEKTLVSYTILP